MSSLADVDTLLAIASRRDERRTLPEPLPDERRRPAAGRGPAVGLVAERPAVDVRRARRAGSRVERLAEAVYVPDNLRHAGLVVAIVVSGKGPVLFDGGRAAQSMLLAAWAEGLASCPNGIKDADLARAALDAGEDETPVIVLTFGRPERPRNPEAAHGRGVERAGEPEADRRRRARHGLVS